MDQLEKMAKHDFFRIERKRRIDLLSKTNKSTLCLINAKCGVACGMPPSVDSQGNYTSDGFCSFSHCDLAKKLAASVDLDNYYFKKELDSLKISINSRIKNLEMKYKRKVEFNEIF